MAKTSVVLGAVVLLLAGCSDSGHSDLEAFIRETMARPAGEIEPIPAFRPYEAYEYSSVALRSPFQPPQVATAGDDEFHRKATAPDESRPREFLETVNFAALDMVGTLERDGVIWGLVADGRGGIHRVTTGNYMGRNHGRIVAISQTQIDVEEIVPDGKGGWVIRPRVLALGEK